jgi:hypothetical protein
MKNIRAFITGLLVGGCGCLAGTIRGAEADAPIYSDALLNGWQSWGWTTIDFESTNVVHGGGKAIQVTIGNAWEAIYLHHNALDTSAYAQLSFWIHGGAAGGQQLQVQALLSGQARPGVALATLQANTWRQVTLSMSDLGVAGQPNFDGFWIQDRAGRPQATFYLDDLVLLAAPTPPATNSSPMVIQVDAARNRRPISELIYGVSFGTSNQLAELNCPVNRSGGNSESRYNWQINAHNRGADWYFESLADEAATAGADADQFVAASLAGGASPILTIPMVGWVARLGANRAGLASYSIRKYGAQTGRDAQWFPDAGNGVRQSDNLPITWNDPTDANVAADAGFQSGWIQHLTNRWGTAAGAGVRLYLMDNEPSLWHATHRDVHPAGADMEEVRDRFLAYSTMVKNVDPGARVGAPEEWGWSGYWYSGADQQAGATNGWSQFPDRARHGGWDYLPWFLDQARQRDAQDGIRRLDYFTVHYYPQGGEFPDDTSPSMQLRRNRSTRSLWDPAYVDESWISAKVNLIPRIRQWVDAYYPGTKIGITEYNWGAEGHPNGATAQADLLGLFGREGLDLATRWTAPPNGSPAARAFQIYRNYDGRNSAFGETSIAAAAPDPDRLSAFAAIRGADGALTIMVVNKQLQETGLVQIAITHFPVQATAQVWQLAANDTIRQLTDVPISDGSLSNAVPPQSLTLFVAAPVATAARLTSPRLAPDGQFEFWLEGVINQRYEIQVSADLAGWSPLQTLMLAVTPLRVRLPVDASPLPKFYRVRGMP